MEIIKRKILLENSIDRSSKDQKKWGVLTASTFYINILIQMTVNQICKWLYLNCRSLVWEATALPIDQQK